MGRGWTLDMGRAEPRPDPLRNKLKKIIISLLQDSCKFYGEVHLSKTHIYKVKHLPPIAAPRILSANNYIT
jgi:hypothetical protein